MTWNYRLCKWVCHDGEEAYEVMEVYYDEAGEPNGYCSATPFGASLDEIREDLRRMTEALDRPILVLPNPPLPVPTP